MSSLRTFVFAVAALLIVNYASAIGYGSCPDKNKVYNNKPTCFSDADCQKYGQICCPNQFNTKSCVARAQYSNSESHQKATGGAGVYCAGVKCRPHEVCRQDPYTKKLKCMKH